MSNLPGFFVILLLLAGFTAASAQAHTPYLAPATYDIPRSGWVTLDASFADHFFVPEVVFDDSEFRVLGADGQWGHPATVHRLKTRAVIEHLLDEKGTYRFSTGTRHGAVFRFYELNGEREALRSADEPLPEGAVLLDHFQAVTLAETYLTLGAPTRAALKPHGQGLEVVADTHPNDVYHGEALRVRVLFEGEPLPEQELQLFAAGGGDDKAVLTAKAGADGYAELAPLQAGVYLMRARHRAPAPAGAAAPHYSYTYTLAFEVAEQ